MSYISLACYIGISLVCANLGIGIYNWQLWAIMLLAVILDLVSHLRAKRSAWPDN